MDKAKYIALTTNSLVMAVISGIRTGRPYTCAEYAFEMRVEGAAEEVESLGFDWSKDEIETHLSAVVESMSSMSLSDAQSFALELRQS